jgi:hypothetical protein
MSRPRLIAAIALALPVLAWSAPFLFGPNRLYGQDFAAYYGPHSEMAREEFSRTGTFPRWNPRQYAGTPYLGNFQQCLYYPPNLLFLRMEPVSAFELYVILHLLAAAWGMYRFARALGVSRTGGVIAGIAYSVSFSMTARIYAGHVPYLVVQAWAPILLWLTIKLIDRPTLLHTVALAGAIGAAILGGNPQMLYHLVLLAIAVATWRLVRARAGVKAVSGVLAAVVIGGGVGAIQLLPAFEVAAHSVRGQLDSFYAGQEVPAWQSLVPENLVTFALPYSAWSRQPYFGHEGEFWEKSCYVGILPLFLAGGAFARRKGPIILFGIAGFVALLAALARDLPVHTLLSLLPKFGSFRVPSRIVWVTILSVSVLAGFGWDVVAERRLPRVVVATGLALFLVAIVLILFPRIVVESVILLALAGLAAALVARAPEWRWAGPAAALLVTVDLCFYSYVVPRFAPVREYRKEPWYARHIGPERRDWRLLDLTRIEAEPVAGGFRLLEGCGYPVPSGLSEYYRTAWEDPAPMRAESLSHGAAVADPDVLATLNLRWIVTNRPHPRWREVGRHGADVLYEDREARPMAWFLDAAGGEHVARPDLNTIDVKVWSDRSRYLFVSETWMPGWRAEVNGAPAAVHRAFGAILCVKVPKGSSRVRIVYDPESRRSGTVATVLALAAAGLLLFLGLIRR